jgi:adenosylcobinamide-phosphate synthase
MILDALFGEPKAVWDRWPHPAILMGRVIAAADARFNQGEMRRAKGVGVVVLLVALTFIGFTLLSAIPGLGPLAEILIGAALLAQKSLVDHVRAVANALRYGVGEGRQAVSMIVGRDTRNMTEAEVARAAIESAAENFSDGFVAPLFWFVLLGLPGLVVYKLVNTADSMIGHRTDKYEAFGWAAARFDDVLNLIPARLTALVLAAAALSKTSLRIAIRDAGSHRSPNAGWPEGAMAGALDVALSGPRSYNGQHQDLPWVNPNGERLLGPKQIDQACTLLWRAWGLCFAVVAVVVIA